MLEGRAETEEGLLITSLLSPLFSRARQKGAAGTLGPIFQGKGNFEPIFGRSKPSVTFSWRNFFPGAHHHNLDFHEVLLTISVTEPANFISMILPRPDVEWDHH